jgi:hypothetical protein
MIGFAMVTSSFFRRKRLSKMAENHNRAKKDREIVTKEDRLSENAVSDYLAELKAKEERQYKGLGSLIATAQDEMDEVIARKKAQGLGAAISSGNSTLG